MASPYRVFDLRVKNARRAVADLRTSADVGHETAQQSGELLWRLLMRRMPGPRQHLYGAAPQVRYGQSAQVLQADELIARPCRIASGRVSRATTSTSSANRPSPMLLNTPPRAAGSVARMSATKPSSGSAESGARK